MKTFSKAHGVKKIEWGVGANSTFVALSSDAQRQVKAALTRASVTWPTSSAKYKKLEGEETYVIKSGQNLRIFVEPKDDVLSVLDIANINQIKKFAHE